MPRKNDFGFLPLLSIIMQQNHISNLNNSKRQRTEVLLKKRLWPFPHAYGNVAKSYFQSIVEDAKKVSHLKKRLRVPSSTPCNNAAKSYFQSMLDLRLKREVPLKKSTLALRRPQAEVRPGRWRFL